MSSRKVKTNQDGVHPDLLKVLERHRQAAYRKPVAEYNREAFARFLERWESMGRQGLILDSGCGVGESTHILARAHPDCLVVGIDKSAVRLQKSEYYAGEKAENVLLLRAEMFDFWRLLREASIRVRKHYILYPNPWPKKSHLKRRIHGHPAFFDLIALGGELELRSNWEIYVQEFALACRFALGISPRIERHFPNPPITPHERKYYASGHELFRLMIKDIGGA